jgi:hypothetical protein
MKRSLSPLERALSADANAARRTPPARVRDAILSQLEAQSAQRSSAPEDEIEPVRGRPRLLRPLLAVAAGVLIVGLAWLVARPAAPSSTHTASGATPTPASGMPANGMPATGIETALTSLRPDVAIDGPLLAEAENLSRDTTRATRYLIDRVTTPFLPRSKPR